MSKQRFEIELSRQDLIEFVQTEQNAHRYAAELQRRLRAGGDKANVVVGSTLTDVITVDGDSHDTSWEGRGYVDAIMARMANELDDFLGDD